MSTTRIPGQAVRQAQQGLSVGVVTVHDNCDLGVMGSEKVLGLTLPLARVPIPGVDDFQGDAQS